jgi:4-hydroxy-2-oxoheptanedioate aldolase
MRNRLKEKLRGGQVALGCAISLYSTDVVELVSQLGFDWLWFDTEHSPLNAEMLQPLLAANRRDDVTPVVRPAWNDLVMVKKALDVGAQGLIVPWVNNAAQAEAAVQAAKYPPRGLRGFGPRRAANYGLDKDYVATANDETLVVVQIETAEAVENFESIVAVDGVDAYLIGPNDLANSMGYLGQPYHPEMEKVIADLAARGKKAKVPAGIIAAGPEQTRQRIDQGFQMINVGADLSFLQEAASGLLKAVGRGG